MNISRWVGKGHLPWNAVVYFVIFALLFIALPNYQLLQFGIVFCYACALMGLHLLTGISGQINIGQGAFYALGGYSAAILQPYLGSVMALIAAIVVSLAVGWIAGYPAMRLRGIHLGLVTLGIAAVVPGVALTFPELTNGRMGLHPETWEPLPFVSDDRWFFLVSLALLGLCALVSWRLASSRYGIAMHAIASSEVMASSMGANVHRVKIAIFAVSSAMAGAGGACAAFIIGFISPDSFPLTLSIYFIAGAVIGGLGFKTCAIVGAAFIYYGPQLAETASAGALRGAPAAILGLFIVLTIILAPTGLAGIATRLRRRLRLTAGTRTKTLGGAGARN